MWLAVENIGRAQIAERTILLQARKEITLRLTPLP